MRLAPQEQDLLAAFAQSEYVVAMAKAAHDAAQRATPLQTRPLQTAVLGCTQCLGHVWVWAVGSLGGRHPACSQVAHN